MPQGEISADSPLSDNLDEVGAAGLASTLIAAAISGLGAIGFNFPPAASGLLALTVGVLFYFVVSQRKRRAKRREGELVNRLRADLSIRLAKLSKVDQIDEWTKIRSELITKPLPDNKRKALERELVAAFEIREGARDIEAIGVQAVEVHTTNKTNEELRAQILQLERDKEDLRQEAKTDRKFLDRLRRDPDFQDAIARKELGYGKTNERLYRLPKDDEEKPQAQQP